MPAEQHGPTVGEDEGKKAAISCTSASGKACILAQSDMRSSQCRLHHLVRRKAPKKSMRRGQRRNESRTLSSRLPCRGYHHTLARHEPRGAREEGLAMAIHCLLKCRNLVGQKDVHRADWGVGKGVGRCLKEPEIPPASFRVRTRSKRLTYGAVQDGCCFAKGAPSHWLLAVE